MNIVEYIYLYICIDMLMLVISCIVFAQRESPLLHAVLEYREKKSLVLIRRRADVNIRGEVLYIILLDVLDVLYAQCFRIYCIYCV